MLLSSTQKYNQLHANDFDNKRHNFKIDKKNEIDKEYLFVGYCFLSRQISITFIQWLLWSDYLQKLEW